MQRGIQKNSQVFEGERSTLHQESPKTLEMTAKMRFYAVHNAGEQLRWQGAPVTGKKPDRMEGR